MQKISLDSGPLAPRPNTLLPYVIKETILTLKQPESRSFGEWTWDYSEVSEANWSALQNTLRERITSLFDDGLIRYGSW